MHLTTTATIGADRKLNASASDEIRQHLASLAPGTEIAISVRGIGDALSGIERLATWYNSLTEAETNNPAHLDALMAKSDELAYYILRFSQDVGECYARKNATELARKSAYNQAMHRARKEANAAKERFVANAADIEAQVLIADLLNAESVADAEYKAAYLLLESANNIQNRISQRLAALKSYRDATLRSGNQHFPEK